GKVLSHLVGALAVVKHRYALVRQIKTLECLDDFSRRVGLGRGYGDWNIIAPKHGDWLWAAADSGGLSQGLQQFLQPAQAFCFLEQSLDSDARHEEDECIGPCRNVVDECRHFMLATQRDFLDRGCRPRVSAVVSNQGSQLVTQS